MPKARLISTSTKMPEPLTDRQCCFKCNKTVTGKFWKKFSKCAGCHAITYCGVECQREDRARHQWNCVPVMVTEYEGKGRGLVAARDIKIGELIFKDKSVIKLETQEDLNSLLEQLDKLPDEAKLEFDRLKIPEGFSVHKLDVPSVRLLSTLQIRMGVGSWLLFRSIWLAASTFIINNPLTPESVWLSKWTVWIHLFFWPWIVLLNEVTGDGILSYLWSRVIRLYLSIYFGRQKMLTIVKFAANSGEKLNCHYLSINIALINHSCSPNVTVTVDDEFRAEVRAIKDISKGDEITKCYLSTVDFKKFCRDRQKRIQKIQEEFLFECKCCLCSGTNPGQESMLKKLLELSSTLTPSHHQKTSSDWRSYAKTLDKVVEMTNKLHVGPALELKFDSSTELAIAAHLARDKDLLGKALDNLNKLVEDTQLECLRLRFESVKQDLAKWANKLKSRKFPKKDEFDSLSPILNKVCILE